MFFICLSAMCIILTACTPALLSDSNEFLKSFVGHEYLGFMGVIVTISLSSAYNINSDLNKIEEKAQTEIFSRTRADLKHSAFALIFALTAAFVEAIVKYSKPLANESWQSSLNSFVIVTVASSVMILIDLTTLGLEVRLTPRDAP